MIVMSMTPEERLKRYDEWIKTFSRIGEIIEKEEKPHARRPAREVVKWN